MDNEKSGLGGQILTDPEIKALFEDFPEESIEERAESLKSKLEMKLLELKGTLESISKLSPEDPVRRECVVRIRKFCSENSDLFA
jgi:hypothetical protein